MKNEKIKNIVDSFLKKRASQLKEEVCIEPFVFLDENNEVIKDNPNKGFEYENDVIDESTLELDEEDLVYDENEDVDDIEETVKEIADEIEPIDSDLMFEVNDGDKCLINKVNCNIKHVPLLNVYYITNTGIEIMAVNMTDTMTTDLDIELVAVIKYKENFVLCKMKFEDLYDKGLIKAVSGCDIYNIEMSNVEFRGLTNEILVEELAELVDLNEVEELLKNQKQ